ncbi:protein belonging to Uncharacterized protein family UPF0145, partial [Rhodopirellula europaea 6C]
RDHKQQSPKSVPITFSITPALEWPDTPPGGPACYIPSFLTLTQTQAVATTPFRNTIEAYRGPVFGETIYGANVLRDISAAFTDVVGGRAGDYEKVLIRGRNAALKEMSERAKQLGANAVIGIRFDYSTVGRSMLMICSSGTAVIANPRTPNASP